MVYENLESSENSENSEMEKLPIFEAYVPRNIVQYTCLGPLKYDVTRLGGEGVGQKGD
jgi:hypothetical protein